MIREVLTLEGAYLIDYALELIEEKIDLLAKEIGSIALYISVYEELAQPGYGKSRDCLDWVWKNTLEYAKEVEVLLISRNGVNDNDKT